MVSVRRKESHLVRREEQAAWSLGSGVVSSASWLFIDGNLSQGNGIFFELLCLNPLPVKHDSLSPLIYLSVQSL